MSERNPTLRRVGFIIFSIAIIVGLVLTLLRSLPDLEASQYGFVKYGYPRLSSLSCPVLMTAQESANVTIRLSNSLDRNLSYYVETQLSAPYLMVTNDQQLDLAPGDSRKLAWAVDKSNIDLGNFIFARVYTSAATTNGFHESTCGTFVLKLPFVNGAQIYWSLLFLSVACIALGYGLWYHHRDQANPTDRDRTGWMAFIAAVCLVGMVTSLFNYWFVGILMVLLSLLASAVYLSQSNKSMDISIDQRS